jgi:hypothetical protein
MRSNSDIVSLCNCTMCNWKLYCPPVNLIHVNEFNIYIYIYIYIVYSYCSYCMCENINTNVIYIYIYLDFCGENCIDSCHIYIYIWNVTSLDIYFSLGIIHTHEKESSLILYNGLRVSNKWLSHIIYIIYIDNDVQTEMCVCYLWPNISKYLLQ